MDISLQNLTRLSVGIALVRYVTRTFLYDMSTFAVSDYFLFWMIVSVYLNGIYRIRGSKTHDIVVVSAMFPSIIGLEFHKEMYWTEFSYNYLAIGCLLISAGKVLMYYDGKPPIIVTLSHFTMSVLYLLYSLTRINVEIPFMPNNLKSYNLTESEVFIPLNLGFFHAILMCPLLIIKVLKKIDKFMSSFNMLN